MAITVDVGEPSARLETLVEHVEAGEEVVVARQGVIVARLVRPAPNKAAEAWLAQNDDAIRHYNRRIELEGAFGDDHRLF